MIGIKDVLKCKCGETDLLSLGTAGNHALIYYCCNCGTSGPLGNADNRAVPLGKIQFENPPEGFERECLRKLINN